MSILEKLQKLKETCKLSEEDILREIHNLDVGMPWMNKDTYIWYYILGQVFRPKTILEIGTRFGYSLRSMILGSEQTSEIWFYDSELDYEGSIQYVVDYFSGNFPNVLVNWTKINTRELKKLDVNQKVDLCHIDAEHSAKGCYEDCWLCYEILDKQSGVMLIDDVGDNQEVRIGADKFCKEINVSPVYLDTYHGIYILNP
jgi:predicted O-methyltransferase YrrM